MGMLKNITWICMVYSTQTCYYKVLKNILLLSISYYLKLQSYFDALYNVLLDMLFMSFIKDSHCQKKKKKMTPYFHQRTSTLLQYKLDLVDT